MLTKTQFKKVSNIERKSILEIGSGTSLVKSFLPNSITSDILQLEYLDHVFDCQKIDEYTAISDSSIDILTMTNVMHHLSAPLDFLVKAGTKLKPGGIAIITEPYFSTISYYIYKYLHHEPTDLSITQPDLHDSNGPLQYANIALPYLIFFSEFTWKERLGEIYDIDNFEIEYFSALSYFLTGGISHRVPIPRIIYKIIYTIDVWCSKLFPRLCASFFIIRMTKKLH